jgi:hypothetical protein
MASFEANPDIGGYSAVTKNGWFNTSEPPMKGGQNEAL